MNPTIEDKRQPLPSILTVYRPIEDYWESFQPAGGLGREPSAVLDPFDAFLVHRVLGLVPGFPVMIDAAMARTGGASTVLGLGHPHVREVWAATEQESLASGRALAALRGYVRDQRSTLAPLEVMERSELAGALADQPGVVILADARVGDAEYLAGEISRWLEKRPDALVLVLGLGHVGDCPAIASLLSLCAPESGNRLRLIRELSEVLMASHLGLVTRHDHPHIATILMRLQQFYSGNYCYVDLLRHLHQSALREARIDADAIRGHPFSWALTQEIEELKRSVREAREQAAAAAEALTVRTAELEELRRAVEEARKQLAAIPPGPLSVMSRVRRKLAPTPVGGAWRLAKGVRCKLSPTPVGGAYRLSKRVARACLSRGR